LTTLLCFALVTIVILLIWLGGLTLASLNQRQRNHQAHMSALKNLQDNLTALQGTANDVVTEIRRLNNDDEKAIQTAADAVKAIEDQLKAELPTR
jgi:cell division protein FtsB